MPPLEEVDTVVFDVGETLIDEQRAWTSWARWIGVSPDVFFAVLGAAIDRGDDHRAVFELLVPGFDFEEASAAKAAAGHDWTFSADDLYPDARPCLEELRRRRFTVGIAGNQPATTEAAIDAMALPVDFVVSSAGLGVAKPSPAFFVAIASMAGRPPSRIAYVGDRVDNDVVPAADAGMATAFIRRGPWGHLHAHRPECRRADVRIEGLDELPALLGRPAGDAREPVSP